MIPSPKKRPSVSFIPYGRQSVDADDARAVLKALRSDYLTQGPRVEAFETAIARRVGARFAVAFANGTAALHAACAAAGLGPGDEGVTSAVSFAASANCLVYVGAKPRFADIDPGTAQVTLDTLSRCFTKRTRAVIPVDFAGRPCDIAPIWEEARKKRIAVIADAAHSFGASYRVGGRAYQTGCCAHAHMTAFSFHPVKSFTTGEGGAVTTNDKALRERLRRFRHHGITKAPPFRDGKFSGMAWYCEMVELGYNYRLTDIQAALGISQLGKLDDFLSKRKERADIYRRELAGLVGFLADDDRDFRSANHIFPVLVPASRRDRIFKALRDLNIGVQVHYIPIYRHPFYRDLLDLSPQRYPAAEDYFSRTITLPLFPELKRAEQKRVIKALRRALSLNPVRGKFLWP